MVLSYLGTVLLWHNGKIPSIHDSTTLRVVSIYTDDTSISHMMETPIQFCNVSSCKISTRVNVHKNQTKENFSSKARKLKLARFLHTPSPQQECKQAVACYLKQLSFREKRHFRFNFQTQFSECRLGYKSIIATVERKNILIQPVHRRTIPTRKITISKHWVIVFTWR